MLESRNATLCEFDKVKVKQLDYCNAFVRTCIIDDLIERVELVSYCTPVIAIEYNTFKSIEVSHIAVESATTRNHVGHFLKQYYPKLCYMDIKDALLADIPIDYGRGLRVMIEPDYKVYGLHDVNRLFDVRYESIKPFNRY